MNAKKELLDKFDYIADSGRRTSAAMMYSLDENIGRLEEALRVNKKDENTLIVFLNDNGGATNNFSDNGVLRGMKGSKWEGGIRVGMMMKWKDKIPAGKIYNLPVSSLDLLPTLLSAAQSGQSGSKPLDGVNLIPYLNDETREMPHQTLFWRRGVAAAVRDGKWKLIKVKSDPVLLFDLESDISETNNLAEKYPGIVTAFTEKLSKWEKTISMPKWYSAYGDENQILKHRMNVTGREMERRYP